MTNELPKLTDEELALLEIPGFLKRPPDGLTHAQRLARIARIGGGKAGGWVHPEPNNDQPTKGEAVKLSRLGWSPDQISRIDRAYGQIVIDHGWGPQVRFTPPAPKPPKEEDTK
jgi:hypothetical protein